MTASAQLQAWRDAGRAFSWRGHSIFVRDDGGAGGGGDDDDSVLVCVHGFPTASFDWAPIWPTLRERFSRVIALDMLGYGFSSKPRAHRYSIVEQMDLHEAYLASAGVRRVHLLAHDYGVSVAQEWLARNLEKRPAGAEATVPPVVELRSVVLLNGGLFPETHRPTTTQKLLLSPLGPLLTALMNERRFAQSFAIVFGPQTKPSASEMHDFWCLVEHNEGHRIAHRMIRYIIERREQRTRWVTALQRAPVSVRLVNGPEDPVSGAHMVARYRELIADADVVSLEGIGHYPQVEAPQLVLDAMRAFAPRAGYRA